MNAPAPLKFSCLVDGNRVELRKTAASSSGWRCSCRDFLRPREGESPSCEHINRAFDVWWAEPGDMPEGVTEAKWY
jgi:hypothetical protein